MLHSCQKSLLFSCALHASFCLRSYNCQPPSVYPVSGLSCFRFLFVFLVVSCLLLSAISFLLFLVPIFLLLLPSYSSASISSTSSSYSSSSSFTVSSSSSSCSCSFPSRSAYNLLLRLPLLFLHVHISALQWHCNLLCRLSNAKQSLWLPAVAVAPGPRQSQAPTVTGASGSEWNLFFTFKMQQNQLN